MFGVLHGINEWIDMFTLIRGTEVEVALQAASLILLGSSFFFLALFGTTITTQKHKSYRAILNVAPYLSTGLWILIIALSDRPFIMGDIWARYLFGLPGALLTSYALISQLQEFESHQAPKVKGYLKVSAGAFFAYGLFAGLIVRQADFFPASILNYPMFAALTGLPVQVFRAFCAVIIAYSMIRVLDVFDWEIKASLRNSNEALGKAYGEVEKKVQERTAELQVSEEKIVRINHRNELILNSAGEGIYVMDLEGKTTFVNPATERMVGWKVDELIGRQVHSIIHHSKPDGTPYPPEECRIYEAYRDRQVHHVDDEVFWRKDGTSFPVEYTSTPVVEDGTLLGAVVTFRDVTEHKQADWERTRLLSVLERSLNEIYMFDAETLRFRYVNVGALRNLGYSRSEIESMTPLGLKPEFAEASFRALIEPLLQHQKEKELFYTVHRRADGSLYPVEVHLQLVEHEQERMFLAVIIDITERRRAEQQIQQQVQRLAALRDIDMAITSSLDLRVSTKIILDEVIKQLGVDATDILLLNPHQQTLEYAGSRGFHTDALKHTNLRMGQGYAGHAALERRTIHIPNLSVKETGFARAPLLAEEGFVEYFSVPLISKGHIKGVLEIFHRSALNPDQEWMDFLEAVGTQAAIAVDNAEMFTNLERSNAELILAYDTTLEGWSRALDYRDKETEGHSQRVTEFTLKIARAMGLSEEEMIHVRRGALLHDIGKLGVPDNILLKPGKLTDEEMDVMKKHATIAYEMLSPIPFLRQALDVPYCHHEKWDGTGYPRGLKGEQIPFAARIFAIADVWDALRSDRPYRPAWPKEKTLDHIVHLSGSHFDPKVVDVFMSLIKSEGV